MINAIPETVKDINLALMPTFLPKCIIHHKLIKVRISLGIIYKGIKPPFEFHISRRARDRYGFDGTFFSTDGRLIFPDASSPAGLGAAQSVEFQPPDKFPNDRVFRYNAVVIHR